MPRYIALLRGVNLGGHTVKMDRLKKHFEELGFKKVETFIASGNVIFESASKGGAALEEKIGEHLEKSLGFPAMTFLRTDKELAQVLEHEALAEQWAQTVYIAFLSAPPSKEACAKLMSYRSKTDDFHVNGREAYWLCKSHMSVSPFFRVGLEKALGTKATVRNVTTVTKLVEKYPWKK
ncbi:MAG TPA: DUF1697 domain-containing protein [Gemmatimonadaceae bacterium]